MRFNKQIIRWTYYVCVTFGKNTLAFKVLVYIRGVILITLLPIYEY